MLDALSPLGDNMQKKLKNLPDLKLHTRLRDYFMDLSVPMWLKLIHLFILIDSKSTGKDGYTIWYQNPGLQKKFTLYGPNGDVIWEPSIENIQKSIAKLEAMDLLIRVVSTTGERRMKLNRPVVLQFLREYSIDTELYQSYKQKSRERKLIRRKIITIVDYVNEKKKYQNEQFKRYLEFQNRKYGYDINIPDVDIFAVNVDTDLFVTPAELAYYREALQLDKALDNIWEAIPGGNR